MPPDRDATSPDADRKPDHPGGAEAIYRAVRERLGDEAGGGRGRGRGPVAVDEVAPGIARVSVETPTLPPATHTGCYLVGRSDLLAVDPGSPYPEQQAGLAAAVAERGRLRAIVLTHHHADHTGGAAALAAATGAPIVAHADAAARLAGRVEVDRYLSDGDRLDLGGRRLEVLLTPGHAPGHVCLRDLDSRATIAGDLVAGVGTILIDPDDGDMATYLASLERLLAADVGALLPAHGPVIDDGPAKLRAYLAHRRMREERVVAALAAEPRALAPVCAAAYADTPSWLWPLAERSLLAHLDKLVADGRVVADGAGWRLASAT
ncbi:MAG TPA: MBL fold metallo-hydrolase [Kofleriaceae bacterium]|nr:MBL fold metallo-hydrolase [Kofleriaceae bacterium]